MIDSINSGDNGGLTKEMEQRMMAYQKQCEERAQAQFEAKVQKTIGKIPFTLHSNKIASRYESSRTCSSTC